jgi:hypothetical protein
MLDGPTSDLAISLGTVATTALVGFLTLRGIRHQIDAAAALEDSRRQGALRAAKATLPLVLAEVRRICVARAEFEFSKDPSLLRNAELSEDSFEVLRKCIETADAPEADRLSEIIRIYQILIARSADINGSTVPNDLEGQGLNLELWRQCQHVVNWITLGGLAETLFGYSRGGPEPQPRENFREGMRSIFLGNLGNGTDFANHPLFSNIYDEIIRKGGDFFNPDWHMDR